MTMTQGATATPPAEGRGLDLVPTRPLVTSPIDAFFRLHPGDRPLVSVGQAVARGEAILEHHRDPRTIVVAGAVSEDGTAAPGQRWAGAPGHRAREGEVHPGGELLFRSGNRWRIAAPERPRRSTRNNCSRVQSVCTATSGAGSEPAKGREGARSPSAATAPSRHAGW